MHKTILGYELGLILLPISIIAIIGGGYIIVLLSIQTIFYQPVYAIIYVLLTILLLCSLVALWVFALPIADGEKPSVKHLKYIFLFCNIGAAISILSLFAILINNFGTYYFRQKAEMILVYSIGAPALIPYLHARHIHNQSQTTERDWNES